MTATAPHDRVGSIQAYYDRHAHFYDLTRSYLLARTETVRRAVALAAPRRALEVGCGTGTNLVHLRRHAPRAHLVGVDLSRAMLDRAAVKLAGGSRPVDLHCARFGEAPTPGGPFDLVLFSYSLSMMNPHHEAVIDAAVAELAPGGVLAVVDYHFTPIPQYRRFMSVRQVEMRRHLLPALRRRVDEVHAEVRHAPLWLWSYFLFFGRASVR